MSFSCRLLAAVLTFFTLTGAALAACSDVGKIDLAEYKETTNIGEIQRGLRAAYGDDNVALTDGQFGPYTRARLVALCEDVPRPPGQADVPATLKLVKEYAETEKLWPGAIGDLFTLPLVNDQGAQVEEALGLRLAGPWAMKTPAMGRRGLLYDCADPGGALADDPNGASALGTLTRLYRDKSETEICQMLPVIGSVAEWQQAMERLGQINSGQRTGAIQILQSGDFLNWVEDDAENRLRRLIGTVPAVLALLDEYNTQATTIPGATNYSGGPCTPARIERTLTYYALEEGDVETLDFLVSLSPKLEAFSAEQTGFDSPQALWRALEPVLAEDLDACILAEIEALVKGPDRLPLAFLLRPAATEALMARAALETALPVLTELAPLRTATKAELVNRIRAGLQNVQDQQVGEEVTTAADTLAAASEPAAPATDAPILELELDEADAPAPMMTVTDAADAAVESAIDTPELADTLRNTPMADATVPELIRSQVRTALEDTAERLAQRQVDAQIALIEPAISSTWALTEALQAEILALPYVRATIADATADGALDRLTPLIGVSYPSYRLFSEALDTVSKEPGFIPFSTFVTERIIQKAQKTEPEENKQRAFGPLEIEDCKCVPRRQTEDLQVYGFYPFWLAPTAEAVAAAKTPPAEGEEETPPPPPQTQVDFGTVGQIAFYGLEFRADDTGRVALFHRDRWREAKQTFVNSAHQYRARADLAFDLRDWMSWDVATIDDVVDDIATEMAPFKRLRSYELNHIGEAIPTLFDRPQPDGVTLIFHDYKGTGLGPDEMKTMVRIIKSTYEALPNRDRLHINVAFDFPLVQERQVGNDTVFEPILDSAIFDELFELLQERPYVFQDEAANTQTLDPSAQNRKTTRIINKILLFLERPTTDAKKGLRFRMEQGLFQGELRRQVLRSIIPVVPPAGHREVRTLVKPNDPDQGNRPPFSQLEDDIVYFKDNFSGIGFWPVPDPLGDETATINGLIAKHFNAPALPPVLASFAAPIDRVCTFACPNRAKVALAAMALFAGLVLLTWRSFYSGVVDKIAFRFMTVGLVWIGNFVLLATLLVLSGCDPHSVWPDILMKVLITILLLLISYNFIQRIKNGPMP
ncbi:MAG: hypothetical protein AAF999_14075 [Pseudomonadota bacterium]